MDNINDNGGAPILSYNLQRTESGGSTFFDVTGGDGNSNLNTEVQVKELVKRKSYRFRYRVINQVGPSQWSPESFLVPAVKPDTPPQPSLQSSTDEQIVLLLARSADDGGSFIFNYELEVDASLVDTNFVKLQSYNYERDGFTFTVLANDVNNPLTAGQYYRFRFRAQNALGYSEYSDSIRVGLGSLPSKPKNPARSKEGNSATSIGVMWDSLVGETLEVTVYNLYMDDGEGVNFSLIYSGTCINFTVENVSSGQLYSFYITATNFNGEGQPSDVSKLRACVAPSGVQPPTLLSNSDLEVTLRWAQPSIQDGCPISSYGIFTDLGDFTNNFKTQL